MLTLVAVTVIDVIGRYFFDAPLPGAFELTQILLADLVLAALPMTTFKDSHVEVDLLSHFWSSETYLRIGALRGCGYGDGVFCSQLECGGTRDEIV